MPRAQVIHDELTDEVKSQDRNAVKHLEPGTVQVTRAGDNDQMVYSSDVEEYDAEITDGDSKTAEEALQDTDYRVVDEDGKLYIEKN